MLFSLFIFIDLRDVKLCMIKGEADEKVANSA